MSDAPKPGRLPLFTFDSDNTIAINDPSIPALSFDEENVFVGKLLPDTALEPLCFDVHNVLTTELSSTKLPDAILPTIEQGMQVVIDNISVLKAQTWPLNCENCQDQVARRPSIFVSKHSAEAINRHDTLQLLIVGASTKELTEMIAALRLELHSRQLTSTVQPSSSGTNSTPNSAVKLKRTGRLRGWDTVFDASRAETANGSDADMEI